MENLEHRLPLENHISPWGWILTFEQPLALEILHFKILSVFYTDQSTEQSENPVEALFKESIALLSGDKELSFLWSLSFREIDHYLRDENHLDLTLEGVELDFLKKLFQRLKETFILTAVYCELVKLKPEIVNLNWANLSLVERNVEILAVVKRINQLFSSAVPLVLVMAKKDEIALKANSIRHFPLEIKVLEELFSHYLGIKESNSSFKLVAV